MTLVYGGIGDDGCTYSTGCVDNRLRASDRPSSVVFHRHKLHTQNKKFELMLTRRAKAYSSFGLVV